jgi:hypothetical protein
MPLTPIAVVVETQLATSLPAHLQKYGPIELFGSFVVACRAARLAIEESVIAKANVNHGLAQAAILLTLAIPFGLLALRATIFDGPGTGAHETTVSLIRDRRNVTSVTNKGAGVRVQGRRSAQPARDRNPMTMRSKKYPALLPSNPTDP